MTQNPRQKKLIRDKYLKKAEKKGHWEPSTVIWLLFLSKSSCSKQCSNSQNILQRKLDLKSINIFGISHQNRCKCNWCCKWSKPALCLIHGKIFLVKRKERLPESSSLRKRATKNSGMSSPRLLAYIDFIYFATM